MPPAILPWSFKEIISPLSGSPHHYMCTLLRPLLLSGLQSCYICVCMCTYIHTHIFKQRKKYIYLTLHIYIYFFLGIQLTPEQHSNRLGAPIPTPSSQKSVYNFIVRPPYPRMHVILNQPEIMYSYSMYLVEKNPCISGPAQLKLMSFKGQPHMHIHICVYYFSFKNMRPWSQDCSPSLYLPQT